MFFLGEALSFNLPSWSGGVGALAGIAGPLLGIIFGILILMAAGAIRSRNVGVNAILVIIFGILALYFTSFTGWSPRNPGWNYNVLLIFLFN